MRILFVNPPLVVGRPITTFRLAPLNLCLLKAVAQRAGWEARVFDGFNLPLAATVRAAQVYAPDVIAMTLYSPGYRAAMALAGALKQALPETKLLLGGYHLATDSREVFTDFPADAAIVGEAEIVLAEMLGSFARPETWRAIPGVCMRTAEGVVGIPPAGPCAVPDRFPFPDFADSELSTGINEPFRRLVRRARVKRGLMAAYRIAPICSSRGCRNDCEYCSQMYPGLWRPRSPGSVVDEMEQGVTRFGIGHFFFTDDYLCHDVARIKELCRLVIERGLRVSWVGETRADRWDGEMFDLMRQAGCAYISFGVETGDAGLMRSIGKNLSPERIAAAVAAARAAGLYAVGTFMVGNRNETQETLVATERFIRECHFDAIGVSITQVYPGTRLYAAIDRAELRHEPFPYNVYGGFSIGELQAWRWRLLAQFHATRGEWLEQLWCRLRQEGVRWRK